MWIDYKIAGDSEISSVPVDVCGKGYAFSDGAYDAFDHYYIGHEDNVGYAEFERQVLNAAQFVANGNAVTIEVLGTEWILTYASRDHNGSEL